ncbi:hypothetical protein ABT010_12790 [Streptomyces sp. NPDC002668]
MTSRPRSDGRRARERTTPSMLAGVGSKPIAAAICRQISPDPPSR